MAGIGGTLARRLDALEDAARRDTERRWRAAIDRLRETMDPEHASGVAAWLRQHVEGKRWGAHADGPDHVCPRCIDRLAPPALARGVWLMLIDHLTSGAPVAMPTSVAEVYLSDPHAYPANACEGCGYRLPTRSRVGPDGAYRHLAVYHAVCPVCGSDKSPEESEGA
jgi:hypothetical protein